MSTLSSEGFVTGSKALAAAEPFQFQTWALGLVGARPAGSEQVKKGKDREIDGIINFHDDNTGDTRRVVLSVKAGHTGPDHVRDLRGTVEREKAQIGVLITMHDTTKELRKGRLRASSIPQSGAYIPRSNC